METTGIKQRCQGQNNEIFTKFKKNDIKENTSKEIFTNRISRHTFKENTLNPHQMQLQERGRFDTTAME